MLAEKLKKVLSKFDQYDQQFAEINQKLDAIKCNQVSEIKKFEEKAKQLYTKYLDTTIERVAADIIKRQLLTDNIDQNIKQSIHEAMLPYQEEQAKLINHYQKLFEKAVGNEVETELASVINKKERGK
jgi:F0F1-type ATP synthase alpha subunit